MEGRGAVCEIRAERGRREAEDGGVEADYTGYRVYGEARGGEGEGGGEGVVVVGFLYGMCAIWAVVGRI